MRILIANDDGIHGQGLEILVNWAKKLGQVTVFAPKKEQSGKSQSIDIHDPYEVKKVDYMPDVEAYTVDSTPADCVRVAVIALKKEFDIVFSGINRGTNIGSDIAYSGTVGIICEANLLGIPAVAFSTTPKGLETVGAHLDSVWEFIRQNKLLDKHNLYNVNIPPQVKGIRITRQGGHYSSDEYMVLENDMYGVKGINLYQHNEDCSIDTNAFHNHYVSITPLTIQRTQMDVFTALKALNDQNEE